MRDGSTYRGTRANAAKHMKVKTEMPKMYSKKDMKFYILRPVVVGENRATRHLTPSKHLRTAS